MIISFHPCFDSGNQIILGDRTLDPDILGQIQNAEAIILPQSCSEELFEACHHTRALLFPDYEMRFKYQGKIGQSRLFKDFGLPHPETLCWTNVKEYKKKHENIKNPPHQWPFILKEDRSHEAEGVYFVEDPKSLESALQRIELKENSGHKGFVSQAFIDSKGNVLRTVIMGRRIISYWKRPAEPGQTITTISRGADIDHDWRAELQEKGKKYALDLSDKTGINLGAIDFVFEESDEDPDPIFLEINYFFGRRGIGGTEKYYRLLFDALQNWLAEKGLDPKTVELV
jgi:ribosomal protein S6--L-glutamate ligase